MYQNYFFDFDGTLYDTYPGMVKAFVEAFALQGVELSPNEVYQVMREASVREAYRRYMTSQLDATKLHADYRNLEEKYQVQALEYLYFDKLRVCQVKCVSLYFFLTGSFQSCRFYMPESILFILKNACLHLVIHGQLVANQCPVGYRAAIPFFIQFQNPQVECLAYSSLIGECPFFCDFTKA